MTCKVPDGHYLMVEIAGRFADSRFWGFVPDKNIVKAVVVWLNRAICGVIGAID